MVDLPGEQTIAALEEQQIPFEEEMFQRIGLGGTERLTQPVADLVCRPVAGTPGLKCNFVPGVRHFHMSVVVRQAPAARAARTALCEFASKEKKYTPGLLSWRT